MFRKSAFFVEGKVVETLPYPLFWIHLSNGHCLLGHIAFYQKALAKQVRIGDLVIVRLSPSDLSQGRVILKED